MISQPPQLASALAFYRSGRLAEAEEACAVVLAREPESAGALHLMGLLHLDTGRPQSAAGLISQAILRRPEAACLYNALGNALRRMREFGKACLSFERAIRLQPDYPEALTNLGSALEEWGYPDNALPFHERAVALAPECAEIHNNLANAYRSASRAEDARAAYERALRLRPEYAEAWANLGNLEFDRGAYAEAADHYRRALRHCPNLGSALTNLGSALTQLGRFEEAEEFCLAALARLPQSALAYSNLSSLLLATGRAGDAHRRALQAVGLDPLLAEAHMNLGLALARLHQLEAAEHAVRHSLALTPQRPSALAHLAGVLMARGRFAEAERSLASALALAPGHIPSLCAMGDSRAAQGDHATALSWYDRALSLSPGHWLARPARAMTLLAMGDFVRGWQEYESRFDRGDCRRLRLAQPAWTGEPFAGSSLLIHTEQGLGDTLQFVRFLPSVKRLGGTVILACQPALLPLLSNAPGTDAVIAMQGSGDLPYCDFQLPLLSLPRVLGVTEATLPHSVPYLQLPESARESARERVDRCGSTSALKVGLAWAGNPGHASDVNRSMRFEQVEPLLRLPGVCFFSFQRDAHLPPGSPLIALEHEPNGVLEAAALLNQMDLVITVDTMIAHLAGALGRPVWTLLAYAADWRWMTRREDTPWYPTMRLFRQPAFGDWSSVVERVCAELARYTVETEVLRQTFSQAPLRHTDMEISGPEQPAAPARCRDIK